MRNASGGSMLKWTLLVLMSLCLAAPAAWAKGPKVSNLPASRIKKDLSTKGVVRVDVSKKGGGATWYPSDGRTLWEQTVEVHYKTPYKGVTKVLYGDVEYVWTGGGWKYNKVRPGGSWYVGFKNPTAKEIDAALAVAGQESVLNRYTLTMATKIHSVTLSKDPKWHWGQPTAVTFMATVVYDKKINSTELAKVQQDFRVTMQRGEVGGSYAEFCKTHPDCISGNNPSQQKELSKTKVGAKRLGEMKSLHTVARERYIKPKYASLNPPEKWQDLMQFARYAYKALYSGDEKTWEAFIYFHGDESDKYDNGKEVFIDNKDAFRAQFCPEMVITKKTGRKGQDETFFFSDKGGKSSCAINVWNFNGTRVKRVWCEFAVGDEAKQIAATPAETACVEKLAPDKVYNVHGLKVGDKVISKWHGTGNEYPGAVTEIKEKTLWVKYEDGNFEEVPYDGVRPRDAATDGGAKAEPVKKADEKQAAPPPQPAGPHPSGLAEGDKIMSKWHGTGREYAGKVGKLEAERVFVHYDDGTKEWVPIKAVRKK